MVIFDLADFLLHGSAISQHLGYLGHHDSHSIDNIQVASSVLVAHHSLSVVVLPNMTVKDYGTIFPTGIMKWISGIVRLCCASIKRSATGSTPDIFQIVERDASQCQSHCLSSSNFSSS